MRYFPLIRLYKLRNVSAGMHNTLAANRLMTPLEGVASERDDGNVCVAGAQHTRWPLCQASACRLVAGLRVVHVRVISRSPED